MNTPVKDVMTADVMWAEEDTPFVALASALRQYRVSALPVLDKTARVIGVVSETDLLAKEALVGGVGGLPGKTAGPGRREIGKARGVTARDLMTAPAVTIGPDETVAHAARLMYLRGVKRLPVTNPDGRLAGIVTRSDVLSVYGRPDGDIRADIMTGIVDGERHADPGCFDVGVTDGVVTLSGRPLARAQGHEMVRRIHYVEGVVHVRDRLTYPDQVSGRRVGAGFPVD